MIVTEDREETGNGDVDMVYRGENFIKTDTTWKSNVKQRRSMIRKMADYMKQSLLRGLTSIPKHIPTWYNYDKVGSKLQYECNIINKDYYLARCTLSELERSVQDIVPRVHDDLILVDLGSGNCSKTTIVIKEILKRQKTLTFYPVDISGEFIEEAAKTLSEEYGDSLVVKPIAADFVEGIEKLKQVRGPKLILFFSTIINLSYQDQVDLLRRISMIMSDTCSLVFSGDITQDKEAILKAYNDDSGVVAPVIQYGVTRLNKNEGSQIDLEKFTYVVDFVSDNNPEFMSYVVAYMEAKEDVRYPIPGLGIELVMKKGERLNLYEGEGYSCKYTIEQLQKIVIKAGLHLTDSWTDQEQHVVFCRCMTQKQSH